MKNILLISLNREQSPFPVFPIGVWVLCSYLIRCGFSVDVADLNLIDGLDALEGEYLARKEYDYVGLSVRNIENLSWPDCISYMPEIMDCVACVKRYVPTEHIAMGGAGYSIFGQTLLDVLGLTHGIAGDGERAMARFCGASGPLPEPDFAFARHTPHEVLQTYYERAGMIGVQTRRGCPLSCDYCTYPHIEGTRFRLRSIASVVDELTYLAETCDIRVFYFVDCLINEPQGYTIELLTALAAMKPSIRWYGFASPKHITPKFTQLCVQSGCGGLEIGAESGSDTILKAMGKNFTAADVLMASQSCQEQHLKYCHYLMLGAADETEDTVHESLSLMQQCEASTVILSVGIRLYPSTPLFDRRPQDRMAATPLQPYFLQPDHISLDEIMRLCQLHGHKKWIYPGLNNGADSSQMLFLRKRGIKGPLWDYL